MAVMQPVGGGKSSAVLGQEMIDQFVVEKGHNCIVEITPPTRQTLLQNWAKLIAGQGRMRGNVFDAARSEVVAALEREHTIEAFRENVQREERERVLLASQAQERERLQSSIDKERSGSMDNKHQRSSTLNNNSVNNNNNSSNAALLSTSGGGGGGSHILPLKVTVLDAPSGGGDAIGLRVSLLAAGTQLEWTVDRKWKEFQVRSEKNCSLAKAQYVHVCMRSLTSLNDIRHCARN